MSAYQERRCDLTSEIVAADEHDDPPMSVVIDAALDHLLGSKENIEGIETSPMPGRYRRSRTRP